MKFSTSSVWSPERFRKVRMTRSNPNINRKKYLKNPLVSDQVGSSSSHEEIWPRFSIQERAHFSTWGVGIQLLLGACWRVVNRNLEYYKIQNFKAKPTSSLCSYRLFLFKSFMEIFIEFKTNFILMYRSVPLCMLQFQLVF